MTTTALFLAEAANGLSLFEDLGADAEPRALCFNRATRPHLPEATWFSANPSFDVRAPPPPRFCVSVGAKLADCASRSSDVACVWWRSCHFTACSRP
jgi:hypothetical protein